MGCGASKASGPPPETVEARAPSSSPAEKPTAAPTRSKSEEKLEKISNAKSNNKEETKPAEAPAPAATEEKKDAPVESPADSATATAPVSASRSRAPKKPQTPLDKFHSSVRWNKPLDQLKEFLAEDSSLATALDERNGNQALHLSAQNGHIAITKWLIEECGADVMCVNKKGQTPLHMSIGYDFYEQSEYLLDKGADKDALNEAGHKAITGIDGDHVGVWEWKSAMNLFKAISNEETLETALQALENCPDDMLDKLSLAQHGMKMKKAYPEVWPKERFQAIVGRAPAPA